MEDTLWSEIADAPGEIFDIPEMQEEEEDPTFNFKLNSNFDFWSWKLSQTSKSSSLNLSGISFMIFCTQIVSMMIMKSMQKIIPLLWIRFIHFLMKPLEKLATLCQF